MRINRSLAAFLLPAFILIGCGADLGQINATTEPGSTMATNTASLSDTGISVSPSATPAPEGMSAPTIDPSRTPTPSLQVILDAVGDIMLARTVGQQLQDEGPAVVFAGVQSELDAADVLVGNLECALTIKGTPQQKLYSFAALPEAAQALALAGFDVLSLANNHAMDYGTSGLSDTRSNLDQVGIASVGAGANEEQAHAPVVLERNGLRLAFLAYVDVPVELHGFDARSWIASEDQPGIAWATPDQIKNDVTAAKQVADLVIVLLHSGNEITSIIPNISEDQVNEARTAIDSGASLVIGSHPHILQRIETYHGGLIAYSLGNFVFDDYLGIANQSIILRVMLDKNGVQSYGVVPVQVTNGLPEIVSGEQVHIIETLVAP
jgi:poly-gamma-glutamate capsule biosynthesis protein CapA/YwtB (metallophosphatase superfamily)